MSADYQDEHEGECCESCIQDKEAGYGDDLYGYCCCKAMPQ